MDEKQLERIARLLEDERSEAILKKLDEVLAELRAPKSPVYVFPAAPICLRRHVDDPVYPGITWTSGSTAVTPPEGWTLTMSNSPALN